VSNASSQPSISSTASGATAATWLARSSRCRRLAASAGVRPHWNLSGVTLLGSDPVQRGAHILTSSGCHPCATCAR
jgi:hypothetical protein